MRERVLGTLTIGQAPRADVVPIIDRYVSADIRRIHRGVLDGLSFLEPGYQFRLAAFRPVARCDFRIDSRRERRDGGCADCPPRRRSMIGTTSARGACRSSTPRTRSRMLTSALHTVPSRVLAGPLRPKCAGRVCIRPGSPIIPGGSGVAQWQAEASQAYDEVHSLHRSNT